jgi:tetratricopeptide (TPR) repeat protein
MSELRQLLFAASPERLADLCVTHRDAIVAEFPEWAVVPEPLRANTAACQRWGAALLRIAVQLESLGEAQPLAWLHGEGREDPFHKWTAALARAERLSHAGDPRAAMAVLEPLIAELQAARGPFIDDLLAKAHGVLGGALLALGDVRGAWIFIRAALDGCARTGDLEAIRIHRDNLDLLRALTGEAALTVLRARLVEAQRLSDCGRYADSNEILLELANGDGFEPYVAKMCGLVGLNLYRLGAREDARAWTEMALQACHANEDEFGVTIYSQNLRVIERGGAA